MRPGPNAPPGRLSPPLPNRQGVGDPAQAPFKELRLCADPWRRGGVLDAGALARIGIAGPVLEVVAVTPATITVQMSLAEWYRALGDGTLVCVNEGDG